jgi:hypothetical protein
MLVKKKQKLSVSWSQSVLPTCSYGGHERFLYTPTLPVHPPCDAEWVLKDSQWRPKSVFSAGDRHSVEKTIVGFAPISAEIVSAGLTDATALSRDDG